MTNYIEDSVEDHRADTILINGFIYTVDPSLPSAAAVAIKNGRILALDTTAEIQTYCDQNTQVVDLRGRFVMPGLIDGHCHPTKGAIANLFSCKFEFSATPDEIAQAVSASVAKGANATCILGGRWDSDFFHSYDVGSPRRWLDRYSLDKAVYLRDDSGHNGWANSKALALAGIDRSSEDPAGGKIMRNPDTGEPTGLLIEQADSLVRNRLPDWTKEQYEAGVLEMARIAHSYGITGVTDADATEPLLKAYHAIDSKDALQIHVVASISTPFGHRETPLDYDDIESLRDRYASANVDTRFAKIYLDGVPTAARSAAMLAPYKLHPDFPNDYCGVLHVQEPTLSQDIAALEKRGFTVKLHTAGDGAVRSALDAIEKAHALSGRSDLRHELAHAGFVDAADVRRFKTLNVVADLSPYIWYPAPILDSIRHAIGARAEQYWPIKDLLEAGAPLLAGSDWPAAVSSMDPWKGVQAMVTRRDPSGKSEGALWGEQSIQLSQALKIFTLDGARAQRRESVTGSITVGKWADLIVLNQNLFEIDPDRIAATVVELTMFHGCVVAQK